MKELATAVVLILLASNVYAGNRPSISWSVAFNSGVSSEQLRGVHFSDSEPDVVYFAGSTPRAVEPAIGPISNMTLIYPIVRLFPENIDAQTLFIGSGVFVAKMNYRTNDILFFTHIAVQPGTIPEISDLAVDDSGNVYIVGQVHHYLEQFSYLPLVNSTPGCISATTNSPPDRDGIFIKLNADASQILSSCFFGGSGDDRIFSITVLPDGKYVLVGDTESDDFLTVNAFQSSRNGMADGFYSIFNEDGTPVASSYFGGDDGDGLADVTISQSGRILLAGASWSTNLYTSPNAYQSVSNGELDSILLELDPSDGSIIYSSYLGGSANENAMGIATDSRDNVYIVGTSNSTDYPTIGGGSEAPIDAVGAVVTKLNPTMSEILFSTFRASSNIRFITGEAIDVNDDGDIAIVGQSSDTPWYPLSDELIELDDPNFVPTSFEDGHVIKWLNRGQSYELDYASLFGASGQGQAVELKGRQEVLIGGTVSGNPYLDTTYHYDNVSSPGTSNGAFAMIIENVVAPNPPGNNPGPANNGGGGGSISTLFLIMGLTLRLFRNQLDKRVARSAQRYQISANFRLLGRSGYSSTRFAL